MERAFQAQIAEGAHTKAQPEPTGVRDFELRDREQPIDPEPKD